MIPIAGSTYTYAYAILGEIFAWIIGWDLILEYAVANMSVAVGFSAYLQDLRDNLFGVHLPPCDCVSDVRGARHAGGYLQPSRFVDYLGGNVGAGSRRARKRRGQRRQWW